MRDGPATQDPAGATASGAPRPAQGAGAPDPNAPGTPAPAATTAPAVSPGDRALLLDPASGRRHLVHLDGQGARKQEALGVFDPDRLAGTPWGRTVAVAGRSYVLLPPTVPDLAATLRRKAQIILPKDVSRIVWELGIGHGDRVLESGIGSGGATLGLAHAVGPTGQVVAQELRDEFGEWAQKNLRAAGLGDRVSVHIGDLTQDVAEDVTGPFDACLLDQPQPWDALPNVVPLLAPGARFAAYCPQVGQMEKTVRALRDGRDGQFTDVRALELIERAWEVKERGARPAFEGLGHTGFLVFARYLSH